MTNNEIGNKQDALVNMNFSIWVKFTSPEIHPTPVSWIKKDFWEVLHYLGENMNYQNNEFPFEMSFLTKPPNKDGSSSEPPKSFNDEIYVQITKEGNEQNPNFPADLDGWSKIKIRELGCYFGKEIYPGTKHVLVKDDFKYK